ncbi:hypothetical protein [Cohnella thailandensis]|uniref:Lipoprotein n=1 Tax=Cohnella thailandensis TaxID=557557 RepID=A0A841SQT1_9BACL|nr:hypothetical protein [Cohnella thailandensis]MBB6633552.1 hypothetical protein [Cohnella thailandensis]MBP1974569.1 cytoskeletal protein RodZ [Cohnella thailandensis]
MKRLGKNTAWTIGLLSMLLLASACSNDNNNAKNANATPSASASSSPTESSSASPEASPSASPSSSPSESPSASPSNEVKKLEGSGVYNGQVDNHSIEVEFNGEPTVFQIDSDVSEKISDWNEGIKVKFEYTEESIDSGGQTLKQLTIVAIEKQ